MYSHFSFFPGHEREEPVKSAWVPTPHIEVIKKIFGEADKRTRLDFERGLVVNERDYMSRFLTLVNYPTLTSGHKYHGIFMALCAPDNIERSRGIDAILVFKHKNQYKIVGFECKIAKTGFDNGRFRKQLTKQRSFVKRNPSITFFEMFFHRNSVKPFDPDYSSICTLKQLDQFIRIAKKRMIPKWSLKHLKELFEWLKKKKPGAYNIESLVEAVLACELGSKISYSKKPVFLGGVENFEHETIIIAEQIISGESENTNLETYARNYRISGVGVIDLNRIEIS